MYTRARSVFSPSSTFFASFGTLSTLSCLGARSTSLKISGKISGNKHRALDTNTSTTKRSPLDGVSMGSKSVVLSLFVVALLRRFRASASSLQSFPVSDRFGSRSLKFSLSFSVSRYLGLFEFRVKMHTNDDEKPKRKSIPWRRCGS